MCVGERIEGWSWSLENSMVIAGVIEAVDVSVHFGYCVPRWLPAAGRLTTIGQARYNWDNWYKGRSITGTGFDVAWHCSSILLCKSVSEIKTTWNIVLWFDYPKISEKCWITEVLYFVKQLYVWYKFLIILTVFRSKYLFKCYNFVLWKNCKRSSYIRFFAIRCY